MDRHLTAAPAKETAPRDVENAKAKVGPIDRAKTARHAIAKDAADQRVGADPAIARDVVHAMVAVRVTAEDRTDGLVWACPRCSKPSIATATARFPAKNWSPPPARCVDSTVTAMAKSPAAKSLRGEAAETPDRLRIVAKAARMGRKAEAVGQVAAKARIAIADRKAADQAGQANRALRWNQVVPGRADQDSAKGTELTDREVAALAAVSALGASVGADSAPAASAAVGRRTVQKGQIGPIRHVAPREDRTRTACSSGSIATATVKLTVRNCGRCSQWGDREAGQDVARRVAVLDPAIDLGASRSDRQIPSSPLPMV